MANPELKSMFESAKNFNIVTSVSTLMKNSPIIAYGVLSYFTRGVSEGWFRKKD